MGTRWLTEDEQQAWRSFFRATRLLQVDLERNFQQHGLSTADYEVLVYLSEAPRRSLRMGELAKGTLLEKSRLSHQITRMEKAGLVRREACPDDRRGQLAVLTDAGWETIQRIAPYHVENVRMLLIDHLTQEQVTALAEIFGPLVALLNTRCPAADQAIGDAIGDLEVLDDAQGASDPAHRVRIGNIDHIGEPSLHGR